MADNNNSEESTYMSKMIDNFIHVRLKTFAISLATYIWTGARQAFSFIISDTWHFWQDTMAKVEPEVWKSLLDPYLKAGYLTTEQADTLYKLKDTMHPFDLLLYIGMNFKLVSSMLDVNLDPAQAFLSYAQNKKMRPALPEYRDIIQAAFVAPERTGDVREVMKQRGFPDKYIDLLFLSLYRLYDENTVRELYLRGVLSETEMINRMQELGYTETRIKEMVQAWDIIPGAADILHMVGKEAFEPDAVALMGLDDEFPEEQTQWLEKQGLNRFWQLHYWRAHWEQPSIQMGFDMLHRGVIDKDELDMLFKTVEIPPYWRNKITEIAYQPLTRVDVRRMHAIGTLDESGVFKAYTDLGYNEENAWLMTKFTVDYNRTDDKELTKAQVLKAYREKAMQYNAALDLLKQIGYPQDTADYLLIFEDYQETLELQQLQVTNIKDRYINNLINKPDAQRQLDALDLESLQVEILLEKWDIQVFKDRKVPSKTDLKKFLHLGIITTDQFRQEMEKLGYNYLYAQWFEQEAQQTAPKGTSIK